MSTQPWWHAGVVYQVYPRSFADGNGDGVGDLQGVIDHLDHLQHLGVDAVWLSPVYASPMVDNGYDISDYQDINPTFGTLETMAELTEAAHARGIRVVMDLVVNHTSDQHRWFVEARSSRESRYRDFYWWQDEPTNWESAFSGPAWTLDEATGQHYLHLFAPEQPDLNWENPEVRETVYAMMRWWLDRGVDGFRMDVVNLLSKRVVDGRLVDAAAGSEGSAPATADAGHHVLNGPRIHEFLAEMRREVFEGRVDAFGEEPVTIGETPGTTVEHGVLYTDPARRELDMVFTFEHVDLDSGPGGKWDLRPFHLPELKAVLGRWQDALAERGWNSLYWSNHDQPRIVSRYGDDSPAHRVRSATALATVLHLHRGTVFVYQGEELGLTNIDFAGPDDFEDLESVNHYREAVAAGADPEVVLAALRHKSRDNARAMVPWEHGPDERAVLDHYRRLVALRHDEPVVATGDFTMLLPEHAQVYAFTRSADGVTLTVVANLSGDAVDAAAAGVPMLGEVVLANDQGEGDVLGPWAARVLRHEA